MIPTPTRTLHLNPEGDSFRATVPPITPGILSDLQTITRRMADLGFDEGSVEKILQVHTLSYRQRHNILPYRSRLRSQGGLGTAIAFWLLQEWITLEQARACLGDHAVSVMHRLGWLELSPEGLRSRVDLYPCHGLYFFSDTANSCYPWPEQVYWLGSDSYTLAYCTPRQPRGRSLDLCTGSGVHAILARTHCQHSMGIDINPRALEFSRLNARLNNLDVQFSHSDCYQSVGDEGFDLITLNPPFVPTPENVAELYRAGGGTGESITERVARGLPKFLHPGGLFSMATEAPRRAGHESPLERLGSWLGPNWGVAALYKHEFSMEEYILGHVLGSDVPPREYEQEFQRWYDSYLQQGITSMVSAQFYAVHLPAGSPGWSCERSYPQPLNDQSDLVHTWLQALQAWHGPWPGDFKPRLHPQVEGLFLGEEGAMIAWKGRHWCLHPTRYGPDHAQMLRLIQHGASLAQLEAARPDARSLVQELGCELVIDCFQNPSNPSP